LIAVTGPGAAGRGWAGRDPKLPETFHFMRIDLKGHPFVGPAGRLLDRAIADAGLDRRAIFVTNEAATR